MRQPVLCVGEPWQSREMEDNGARRCQLCLKAGLDRGGRSFRGLCHEAPCKAEDSEMFLVPQNTGRGILMQGLSFLFPAEPYR